MNRNPQMAGAVAGAAIFLVVVFVVWHFFGGGSHGGRAAAVQFYSDDDGETYFIAAASQSPPFDHNGKTAVLASVYRCGSTGKPFVAYLLKYDDKIKAILDSPTKDPKSLTPSQLTAMSGPTLVKKPRAGKWIDRTSATPAEYQIVVTPVCPDGGSGPVSQLMASDPDNGARPE